MATFLENTAEGGTHAVSTTTGNSGGASGNAWSSITKTGTGDVDFRNTNPTRGTLSYRLQTPANNDVGGVVWDSTALGSNQTYYVRCYVYITGYGQNTNIEFQTSGGASVGLVHIGDTGVATLRDSTGATISTGPTLALSTHYRIELRITAGATTDAAEARVYLKHSTDDVDTMESGASGDWDVAGLLIDQLDIRHRGDGAAGAVFIDDIVVSDYTWIGPSQGLVLRNTAEGQADATTATQGSGGNTGGVSGNYFDEIALTGTGAMTFSSTVAAEGGLSYRLTNGASTGTVSVRWDENTLVGGYNDLWFRCYAYWTGFGTQTGFRFTDVAITGVHAKLNVSSTGMVTFNTSVGGDVWPDGPTLTLGTWYRFEIRVRNGGGTNQAVWDARVFLGNRENNLANVLDYVSAQPVTVSGPTECVDVRFEATSLTPNVFCYIDDWVVVSGAPTLTQIGPVGDPTPPVPSVPMLAGWRA